MILNSSLKCLKIGKGKENYFIVMLRCDEFHLSSVAKSANFLRYLHATGLYWKLCVKYLHLDYRGQHYTLLYTASWKAKEKEEREPLLVQTQRWDWQLCFLVAS